MTFLRPPEAAVLLRSGGSQWLSWHDQSVTVVDGAVGLPEPVSDTTRMCSVPGFTGALGHHLFAEALQRAMLTRRTATG